MPPDERAALERRARLLAWGGNAWHVVEFALAVGAGIAAGSVALVAFGIDSVIEALAGGVIVWLFSGGRGSSHVADRRAQQLIAASYAVLVAYVGVAAGSLAGASCLPPPDERFAIMNTPPPIAATAASPTPISTPELFFAGWIPGCVPGVMTPEAADSVDGDDA